MLGLEGSRNALNNTQGQLKLDGGKTNETHYEVYALSLLPMPAFVRFAAKKNYILGPGRVEERSENVQPRSLLYTRSNVPSSGLPRK